MDTLPHLSAATIERLVPPRLAVRILEDALRGGLDPEDTPPRPGVDLPGGQLLMMPASALGYAGVKAVTIAPGNPARGLPRIQGAYLLFDGDTLRPLATLDGIALTSLRTPAVSALAVDHLADPSARRLVVFGTGPQAWGHVRAIREIRPIDHVTIVGRNPTHTEALTTQIKTLGLPTTALTPPPPPATASPGAGSSSATPPCTTSSGAGSTGATSSAPSSSHASSPGARSSRTAPSGTGTPATAASGSVSPEIGSCGAGSSSVSSPSGTSRGATPSGVEAAVAAADIVVCCTTAREPLFRGELVRDGATVVAVGSHEPDARELDSELIARATLVVEARAAALAEAGDVIIPLRQGTIATGHLAGNLAELISGRVTPGAGPRVFKSTGMAWEDLVVAAAAYEAWSGTEGAGG